MTRDTAAHTSTREPGTLAGYKNGCRCERCTAANSDYQRNYRRQIAYGRWGPYVDAGPVRDHVRSLQQSGLGARAIATAAGLTYSTISHFLYGRPPRGIAPPAQIRPATAEALLSVEASLETYPEHAKVDGTGTRRRLQALFAIGWSFARLARQLGVRKSTIQSFLRTVNVEKATAVAVRDLYDQLWDMPPPASNPAERAAVTKTLRMARERGWAPPMAWDDEDLDDPKAQPDTSTIARGRGRYHRRLPPSDELLWLLNQGETLRSLAGRYNASESYVRNTVVNARKEHQEVS